MFYFISVRATFVVFQCVLGCDNYLCIVASPSVRQHGAGFNGVGLVTHVFLTLLNLLGIYREGDMKRYLELPDGEGSLNTC